MRDDHRAAPRRRWRPGDVYALNDPYNGGTHLPDVTVVMPVFDAAAPLLFFTAAPRPPCRYRRHHAGLDAARQHPRSTQEGVLFDNFQLVEHGQLREAELLELLASGA